MTIRSRLADTSAAATSHPVTIPGDAVSGDRIVVGFVNDIASATTSPSTGWTSLDTEPQGTTTNHRLTIFSRVLDGTANDNLTVSLTDGGDGNSAAAAWVSVCLTGDGTLPGSQVALIGGGGATSGTVTAITGLASDDYDSIIFLGLDNGAGASQTPTPPTGWANLETAGTSSDAIYAFSMDQSAAGVTGFSPGNVTWDTTEQWLTGHVVVAQAEGGSGGGGGTVQFRDATADSQDNAPTATPVKPTGLAEGDLMLAIQTCDSDFGLLSDMDAPVGWTEIGAHSDAACGAMKVWQKIAGASEPTDYGFPDNSGSNCTAVIVALHGHDPTTPIVAGPTFTDGNAITDSDHPAPSVTGVTGGMLITAHLGETSGTTATYTPPTGMTEVADEQQSTSSPWIATGVNTLALAADGATGTKTATLSTATPWIAMSLVVAPAPAADNKGAGFLLLL